MPTLSRNHLGLIVGIEQPLRGMLLRWLNDLGTHYNFSFHFENKPFLGRRFSDLSSNSPFCLPSV